ncbi:Lsr2 family protein [Pseudonocardia sp. RS11V-5]|uniref:Lsr2 family DNA-binding protein n=1 Tax=Pseudonocardia terrae TaxID=2905831 RepID=UPI001E36D733|nr:histone-like nucleoid-structuring protein Lsr2 [Pseudonocardia terrae]MCE3553457.1 Lsr2 family protein [Pseudonocardia terrae]
MGASSVPRSSSPGPAGGRWSSGSHHGPAPIVFCDTRALAEEWTYRFLAAARSWADTEAVAAERIGGEPALLDAPSAPPSTAEVRQWARENGIVVPDRGRLRPEVHEAWRAAHQV